MLLYQIPKNVDVADESGRSWKSFKKSGRRRLDCLGETVGRNMNIKGSSSKDFEESEKLSRKSFCHLRTLKEL